MGNDGSGKWIAGIVMLLLAVGIYFGGASIVPTSSCSGSWGWINPLCWASGLGDILVTTFFTILAIWTALFAIMIFALPSEKAVWAVILYIALTFAIVDLFLPDPIPFIDELLALAFSGFAVSKTFSQTKVAEKIGF